MKSINTVTGTASPEQLGTTLMHEHLLIGWAGWELDCAAPKFERKTALKNCVERLKEVRDLGLETFVDPCPMDIGRDVNFMAEAASASGVRIICATGLYKEDLGNTAYFKQRTIDDIAAVYVSEITKGIDDTGIKAGIIKCATGKGQVTKYEEMCLRAAARAQRSTGAPITTHTDDGTMGKEQLDIFASEGVDLKHVIIGHSCGSSDLGYHVAMLDRGCTLGFDRFGLDFLHPDKLRLAALIGLLGVGYEKSAGALARHGGVLARARTRSDPGDGQADRELDADPRLQEYRAGAEAGRGRRREDSRDAGGKSAPILPELVEGPARISDDSARLLGA